VNLKAGAAAAFTVDLLVYPLDTLKTRHQSQDYAKTYASGSQNKPLALRGLYQGVGSVILATLPAGKSTYNHTLLISRPDAVSFSGHILLYIRKHERGFLKSFTMATTSCALLSVSSR
jgi:hypothetical protein